MIMTPTTSTDREIFHTVMRSPRKLAARIRQSPIEVRVNSIATT